jgi:hypothetical protein
MVHSRHGTHCSTPRAYLALEHVGGSLRRARRPVPVERAAARRARDARDGRDGRPLRASAGKFSGIAAGSAASARYLDLGYSHVMVSNDATIFGRGAAALIGEVRDASPA